MAHRHEGLGLARQQLLEPEDAVEVEVVRGLVEQQQLGLAHQLARDREPLLPAARQRRRRLALVREAGAAQRHRDAGVEPRESSSGAPASASRRTEATRRVRRERRILRHVAEAQPLARRARPRVRRLEPGQDLQQRRLARAVRPDEADVVALEDAEREALEQGRGAEGLGEVLAGEE